MRQHERDDENSEGQQKSTMSSSTIYSSSQCKCTHQQAIINLSETKVNHIENNPAHNKNNSSTSTVTTHETPTNHPKPSPFNVMNATASPNIHPKVILLLQ